MPTSRNRKIFYHVTPKHNIRSVFVNGVLPEMAKSEVKRSWFVRAEALNWAIEHVCKRHNVSEGEVSIAVCLIPVSLMRATSRPGAFYTDVKITPLAFYSVDELDVLWIERDHE